MREIRCKAVAVLVGLVLAALGPATASAAAEVLVSQPPGPSGVAVPSDERPEGGEALDDFVIPANAHWHLEAIQVYGTATLIHPRTLTVRIYPIFGSGEIFLPPSREPTFTERVTVGGGPNYLIPVEGAPVLSASETPHWAISVRAQSTGKEDDWNWLTGPFVTGNGPARHFAPEEPSISGAESDLAFQILGRATQTVQAQVVGKGTLVSDPPGISCPGTCEAQFPRGTALTFTASPGDSSQEFSEWGIHESGFFGPPGALSPIVLLPPCGKPASETCGFTLDEDVHVGATFRPLDEVDVLRVVRNRRSGDAQLLVWVPGEGMLGMFSQGLRSYASWAATGGVIRIPLVPTSSIAKTLRNKGRVTVSTEVSFGPPEGGLPATVQMRVTLARKRPRPRSPKRSRPASRKPTHRVH